MSSQRSMEAGAQTPAFDVFAVGNDRTSQLES